MSRLAAAWSLARVCPGLWQLSCPVWLSARVALRLGALGLPVVGGSSPGVLLFRVSRGSVPALCRVRAGVRFAGGSVR